MDSQLTSANQTSNKKLVETGYCGASVDPFSKALGHSEQTNQVDLFPNGGYRELTSKLASVTLSLKVHDPYSKINEYQLQHFL